MVPPLLLWHQLRSPCRDREGGGAERSWNHIAPFTRFQAFGAVFPTKKAGNLKLSGHLNRNTWLQLRLQPQGMKRGIKARMTRKG